MSTRDGASWDSLGKIAGISPSDGIQFLARVRGTWVIGTSGYRPAGEGAVQSDLWWSEDGSRWQRAEVPLGPGAFVEYRAGGRGETLVVLADVGGIPRQPRIYLRTSSGKTWRVMDPGFITPDRPETTGFACDDVRCVVTEDQPFCDCTPSSVVWDGGPNWAHHGFEIPDTAVADERLRVLTSTGAGFLAIAGGSGLALISRDGEAWDVREVMPLGLSEWPVALAVNGDQILAVTRTVDGSGVGIWRGSLSLLEAAAPS